MKIKWKGEKRGKSASFLGTASGESLARIAVSQVEILRAKERENKRYAEVGKNKHAVDWIVSNFVYVH